MAASMDRLPAAVAADVGPEAEALPEVDWARGDSAAGAGGLL